MGLFEIIRLGGPVMFVLFILSIVALAIVLLKIYQYYRSQVHRTGFVEPVLAALRKSEPEALALLAREKSPLARVMETGIAQGRTGKAAQARAEIVRHGSQEVRNMQSFLRALSAIAHLSPLLGLLGTVLGMIQAFQKLQLAGSKVDPGLLAGGIWEALITTAAGLTIAIPAMAAIYFLEGQIDDLRSAMKEASMRILRHFGLGEDTDIVSAHTEEYV